jgi:hypothetical protein
VGLVCHFPTTCKEPVMAKIYKGTVSIVKNTKGEITVKQDVEGKFSHDNAQELWETMVSLAKKHKAEMRFFKPDPKGTVPLLFADRWGNPYVAILPESQAPSKVKVTVTKLA